MCRNESIQFEGTVFESFEFPGCRCEVHSLLIPVKLRSENAMKQFRVWEV